MNGLDTIVVREEHSGFMIQKKLDKFKTPKKLGICPKSIICAVECAKGLNYNLYAAYHIEV